MKPLHEARTKKIRAVELFANGQSYSEIARELGFTNRGSAHRCVTNGLSMYGNTTINDLRAKEFERLDALLATVYRA